MIPIIWFFTLLLASLEGVFSVACILAGYWLLICYKPEVHVKAKNQFMEIRFYETWPEPLKGLASFISKINELFFYMANEPMFIIITQ